MNAVNVQLIKDAAEGKNSSAKIGCQGAVDSKEGSHDSPFKRILGEKVKGPGKTQQHGEERDCKPEKGQVVLFPFLCNALQMVEGQQQALQQTGEGIEIQQDIRVEEMMGLNSPSTVRAAEENHAADVHSSQRHVQLDTAGKTALTETGKEIQYQQALPRDDNPDNLQFQEDLPLFKEKEAAVSNPVMGSKNNKVNTEGEKIPEGGTADRKEISLDTNADKPIEKPSQEKEIVPREEVKEGMQGHLKDMKWRETERHEHIEPGRIQQQPVQGRQIAGDRLQETEQLGRAESIKGTNEGENRIIPQLIDRLKIITGERRSEVSLQLKPESLGRVVIKLEVVDGTVNGKMVVQNPSVKEIVQANLNQLRDNLEQLGMSVSRFSVDVGGERHYGQQQLFQGDRYFTAYKSNHNLYQDEEETLYWRWNDGGTVDYFA